MAKAGSDSRSGGPAEPAAPVLPSDLDEDPSPAFGDGEEWAGLSVPTGDFTGQEAVAMTWERSALRTTRMAAAVIRELRATDIRLSDCDLSGADLTAASFVRVELTGTRMTGTVLAEVRLQDVSMTGCSMDGINVRFAKTERLKFTDCSMIDADFTGSTLESVVFERCDLRKSRFDKIKAAGARFLHCKLDDIIGASALRGVTIDSESMIAVANAVFADMGVTVE